MEKRGRRIVRKVLREKDRMYLHIGEQTISVRVTSIYGRLCEVWNVELTDDTGQTFTLNNLEKVSK